MKKLLLLIPLALALFTAKAQVYTITMENGDPVADGSTTNITLADENTSNDQHWTLHSTTSADLVFQVIATTAVAGTQNFNCVGTHCYAPNDTQAHTESLDAGNIANLSLEYKPNGHPESALITFKIYPVNNESDAITFSINWSVSTGIEEVNTKPSLVAYPNPAKSHVSISYTSRDEASLVIYNIVGETVRKFDLNRGSGKIEVETSDLPSGTYFYSMVSKQKLSETKRLVIKH